MKVLVSDNLGQIGIDMFENEEGIDVDVKTGLSADELKAIIKNYNGLVIRSATKVTEELLEAAVNLKVVGRAGIGLDNVDIPAATKRGIIVMNTPGGNVVTTAEHAIAMILSLTRNIPQGTASLKNEKWDKKRLQGREVFNKTLGVIGFGKIGSIVADRAKGLRMKVVVHDPFLTHEQIEKAGFKYATLDELYSQADYITIHVPKTKDTIHLIDEDAFNKMKNDTMLVNCARGGIINEAALYDALETGKIAGAALDVFETEPPGESPLMKCEKFICTPHLGASTKEAQTNVAVAVASQIIDYLKNETITNAVNAPSITGELLKNLGPFLSLGDRIGALQAQLIAGPLKEVVVEYTGDFHGLDMSPVTTAVLKGFLTPVLKDDVNFINANLIAKERGIKVIESYSAETEDYINLITVKAVTPQMKSNVAGTIYGKKEPRIVKINNFRLDLIPDGHLAMIHNSDKPGAIGSIGTILGEHDINISRMHVGQEKDGEKNIIFLCTDVPIPESVQKNLRATPLIKAITPLEL